MGHPIITRHERAAGAEERWAADLIDRANLAAREYLGSRSIVDGSQPWPPTPPTPKAFELRRSRMHLICETSEVWT